MTEKLGAPLPPPQARRPTISLEVYQQDWVPGFAAFLDDGTLRETGKAHLMINIGTMLSCVESGELPPKDFPYMVAETLMHEAIHALEAWAKMEFSEEKIEELCQKYRAKYRPDDETHWQHDPEAKRDDSNQFGAESVPQEAGALTVKQAHTICEQLCFHMAVHGGEGNPFKGMKWDWFADLAAPQLIELLRAASERGVPLEEKNDDQSAD